MTKTGGFTFSPELLTGSTADREVLERYHKALKRVHSFKSAAFDPAERESIEYSIFVTKKMIAQYNVVKQVDEPVV